MGSACRSVSFAAYFAGTVLPTLVAAQWVPVPRLLRRVVGRLDAFPSQDLRYLLAEEII
jgi:hypothetical protein